MSKTGKIPPPLVNYTAVDPTDKELKRQVQILRGLGVSSDDIENARARLVDLADKPEKSAKSVLAFPLGKDVRKTTSFKTFAGIFGRAAMAGGTGAATFCLERFPLSKENSGALISYGVVGALLTTLPLAGDLVPLVGGEVETWTAHALEASGLDEADYDHHTCLTDAIELKVRTGECVVGALANGVFGAALGQDLLGGAAALSIAVGSVGVAAAMTWVVDLYVESLKHDQLSAGIRFDLASLDKDIRTASKLKFAEAQKRISGYSAIPIVMGAGAAMAGILITGFNQRRAHEGGEGFLPYAQDHFVPACLNYAAMGLYLVALSRAMIARPTAKATVEAEVLRAERKAIVRAFDMPNADELGHEDGQESQEAKKGANAAEQPGRLDKMLKVRNERNDKKGKGVAVGKAPAETEMRPVRKEVVKDGPKDQAAGAGQAQEVQAGRAYPKERAAARRARGEEVALGQIALFKELMKQNPEAPVDENHPAVKLARAALDAERARPSEKR